MQSKWLQNGTRTFEVADCDIERRLRAEGFTDLEYVGSEEVILSLPPVGKKSPQDYLAGLTIKQLHVIAKTECIDPKGMNKSELISAVLAKSNRNDAERGT